MAIPSAPFEAAKSLFAGLSVLKIAFDDVAQVTGITAATTVFTKTAHGFSVGQALEYVSGTGFTGLTAGQVFYVLTTPDADTFTAGTTPTGGGLTPGTSSDGIVQPITILESAELDDEPEQEEKSISRPDANGTLRDVRTVQTKQAESWKAKFDEAKRIVTIFGGATSGRRTGTVTIYTPDPDDDTGKCAMVSEAFSATFTRDGGMKFGGSDFTMPVIKLKSNKQGAVAWTLDDTV